MEKVPEFVVAVSQVLLVFIGRCPLWINTKINMRYYLDPKGVTLFDHKAQSTFVKNG
jgi:hypothetical protein